MIVLCMPPKKKGMNLVLSRARAHSTGTESFIGATVRNLARSSINELWAEVTSGQGGAYTAEWSRTAAAG